MTPGRWLVLIVWLSIIGTLLYIYFFQPELFQTMFHYEGAGSPYINTPSGR